MYHFTLELDVLLPLPAHLETKQNQCSEEESNRKWHCRHKKYRPRAHNLFRLFSYFKFFNIFNASIYWIFLYIITSKSHINVGSTIIKIFQNNEKKELWYGQYRDSNTIKTTLFLHRFWKIEKWSLCKKQIKRETLSWLVLPYHTVFNLFGATFG